jgi:hypothetical protein
MAIEKIAWTFFRERLPIPIQDSYVAASTISGSAAARRRAPSKNQNSSLFAGGAPKCYRSALGPSKGADRREPALSMRRVILLRSLAVSYCGCADLDREGIRKDCRENLAEKCSFGGLVRALPR